MKVNKFLTALVIAGTAYTSLFVNTAEASNLDTYRNLLMKKTYTIKYVDITPQPRVTNSDKVYIYGKNTMDTSHADYLAYKPTENVVVANGDNRYEEIGAGQFKQCRLYKGRDSYVFTKYNNNGTQEVYGSKKGVVSAGQVNIVAQAMQGYGYGDYYFSRYMNAMIPNDRKAAGQPVFTYVTSGWLNNGLNYEDYKCQEGNVHEAVRYYFNGYTLVKIAAARYWTNPQGVMEGSKTIIKINEFSPTPDSQYLELPAGLKDATKRKK